MKVLVTGATGFIGNYVVQELLKNTHRVIATSPNREKAKTFSWFDNVKYMPFDLSQTKNDENLYTHFHNPEAIIHLAWKGLPNYNELYHIEENLFLNYFFLKNLISHGARDITVAGTCFEYGLQEGELNEKFPSLPVNPYALAKDTLRKSLEQLQKQVPFSLKWGRLFYMFGKGQNSNSLFAQLENALTLGAEEFKMSGGDQQRDYLPVQTMAEYIVKIALQRKVEGIINCCSGIPVSVNNLVDEFLKEKQQSIKLNKGYFPYPQHEPMCFWGDNAKLKTIINS